MTSRPAAVVADASVLTKTFVLEPESAQVLRAAQNAVERGVRLLALPLTRYELGNVLVKYARRTGAFDVRSLDAAVARALALATIEEAPGNAGPLALQHDLSFYDASYLALAKQRTAPLWTFDRRLAAAAEREALLIGTEALLAL